MNQVVHDSSTGHHAAGGDDDHWKVRVVELARVFLLLIKEEPVPLQGRAITSD